MLVTLAVDVVAKYPANNPVTTEIINIYVTRFLNFDKEKIKRDTTRTQPTCGLELKVPIIEMVIKGASTILFEYFSPYRRKTHRKVNISQNSLALSRSPKMDQRKWLGKKAKRQKGIKILFSFLKNCFDPC